MNHYLQFKALEEKIDSNVSEAFFELLAYQMNGKELFDNSDRELILKAGPYIVKTIEEAVYEIRNFPREMSCNVFVTIYYYYMCEASKGMLDKVKKLLFVNEELSKTDDEICKAIEKGIKMLSILLFEKKETYAIEEGHTYNS